MTAAEYVATKLNGHKPLVGIVLGSGLGKLAEKIENPIVIPYKEIPGFPVSTAVGHKGNFIAGYLGGKPVIAMQGRFHYYEGYTMDLVTLPIRVMKVLGIEYLFVSNAAGGVNFDFKVGDLMVITDHISHLPNPLVGPNMVEFGPRFPDMHDCYAHAIRSKATAIAEREHIKLQYGVYVGTTGPTFETQAEYRYFKAIGGDAVGMSTVPEVIVARHMGVPVLGMSVITNCGLSDQKGDHEDVQLQGHKAGERMSKLFVELIKRLY